MRFVLLYAKRGLGHYVEGMSAAYEEEEDLACRLAVRYPDVIYFFAFIEEE